jgi:hypothetical protein
MATEQTSESLFTKMRVIKRRFAPVIGRALIVYKLLAANQVKRIKMIDIHKKGTKSWQKLLSTVSAVSAGL